MKQPTKREVELVEEWRAGKYSIAQLAMKLKKSNMGAYTTIARVFKHY